MATVGVKGIWHMGGGASEEGAVIATCCRVAKFIKFDHVDIVLFLTIFLSTISCLFQTRVANIS